MSKYRTVYEIAEEMILDATENIEWMTIGEVIDDLITDGLLPDMDQDEFEEFRESVNMALASAEVEISFP